jgi:BlaI family penicillinase repressor
MAYYFNEREEQILEILWKTGNGFMKDILTQMPNNEQLPYNTVLSMVRKLERNGILAYESFAGNYRYYPLLDKETYINQRIDYLLQHYFDQSAQKMIAFLQKNKIATAPASVAPTVVVNPLLSNVVLPKTELKSKDKKKLKDKK